MCSADEAIRREVLPMLLNEAPEVMLSSQFSRLVTQLLVPITEPRPLRAYKAVDDGHPDSQSV